MTAASAQLGPSKAPRTVDGPGVTLGSIGAAMDHARAGLSAGTERLAGAAGELSRDVSVEGIVDMRGAETQVKASTAVIRAVDESLGSLIDALA